MKVKVTANVVSFILLLLGRPVSTALDLLLIFVIIDIMEGIKSVF